jgi:Mn-dependent DtxR family transcriptional regulator
VLSIYVQELKKEGNVSIEDIFGALSDNKALVLFNTIAIAEDVDNGGSNGNQIQIRKLGLTTRQYYSRLSRLTQTGLIRRLNGRYSLTLLGKMIYDIHVTTSRLLSYHWKLKAIESIQMSNPIGMKLPEEEFSRLVDVLIDDHKVKNMVTKAIYPQLTTSEKYPRPQKETPQAINVLARIA